MSNDPAIVIAGINSVLEKSAEFDSSRVIQLDNYPELILSLGHLLEAVNPGKWIVICAKINQSMMIFDDDTNKCQLMHAAVHIIS